MRGTQEGLCYLRFSCEIPIEVWVAIQSGQIAWSFNSRVPHAIRTGLDQQHALVGIFAQAGCGHQAADARTDNDVVECTGTHVGS